MTLDERLVALVARSGAVRARTTRYEPNSDEGDPDDATTSPRSANGRNWRVSEVDERLPATPVGSRSRVTWRRTMRDGEGQQQQPGEDDERASA